jgi:hypothetical protein
MQQVFGRNVTTIAHGSERSTPDREHTNSDPSKTVRSNVSSTVGPDRCARSNVSFATAALLRLADLLGSCSGNGSRVEPWTAVSVVQQTDVRHHETCEASVMPSPRGQNSHRLFSIAIEIMIATTRAITISTIIPPPAHNFTTGPSVRQSPTGPRSATTARRRLPGSANRQAQPGRRDRSSLNER